MTAYPNGYTLENTNISRFSYRDLLQHSSEIYDTGNKHFLNIEPVIIEINYGLFTSASPAGTYPEVSVLQKESSLILSCNCNTIRKKLCEHQVQVLYNIMNREALRIFFDEELRLKEIKKIAKDYGLENEGDLEKYFKAGYVNNATKFTPLLQGLIPVNRTTTGLLRDSLLPKNNIIPCKEPGEAYPTKTFLVIRKHRYYEQFTIELFKGKVTGNGRIINPFSPLDPLQCTLATTDISEAKFYSAIAAIQNNQLPPDATAVGDAIKIIIKNPTGLDVFYHNGGASEAINAGSVVPVQLQLLIMELRLTIDLRAPFYEVSAALWEDGKSYPMPDLHIKYNYFIHMADTLHYISNPDILRIINFFKSNNPKVLVHVSKFDAFKAEILDQIEQLVNISYSYIKTATEAQIVESGYQRTIGRMVYLYDKDNYVSIIPVMKYGNTEVPVYSEKQIYDRDQNGNMFKVERDMDLEARFTSVLLRQHPDFRDQLGDATYFYLHKTRFLDEDWFLNAFEEWEDQGIVILGYSELKNNKLNIHKAKISVNVNSGLDWFNTSLTVSFGKQKARLKQLSQSIKNRSRFVLLDDGTMGILPGEWAEKISHYLEYGTIVGELLRIPKSNFTELNRLFNELELSQDVQQEIKFFTTGLSDITSIKNIPVPIELKATLRDYQKQGLNWLNFLDDHNFGACLADDMGLGKTIQVIAFILSQRTKHENNTNLVVVPTSLLFNWQAEVEKYAPTARLFTYYGPGRIKDQKEFSGFEIILTTYGMLVSDIRVFKEYFFNYIFLDESQVIKNPESQRHKAARMLQSRNKVVMTGTPIENGTLDIYGQLSFACPGLLGNKRFFRDIYAIPIDKFQNSKRSDELYQKIKPFILRRTKKQVAKELPEKTEMIIYCEMGEEQRAIYNSYEKDFRDFILGKNDDDLLKSRMHVLAGLMKLRQICNAPLLVKNETLRHSGSAKIDMLLEQIETKSQEHKILVFSQFTGMLDLLAKALKNKGIIYEYLSGATKNRGAMVNDFQDNAAIRVFLISLKTGGNGLNLTEADYVYLIDPWWNPAVENQAIDRCYRIGQKKNVIAVRLITPGTIEEKIMMLQESKTKLASNLVKTDASVLKALSKADLLDMLE